jgi:hypothetical protein
LLLVDLMRHKQNISVPRAWDQNSG